VTTVVHVLEALEGGTARHVTDVVTHVVGVTHHVVVPHERVGGTTDRLAVPGMQAAGAEVHRVEMRRFPISPRNGAALVELRRLLHRLRPDVVHGHSAVGGALARTAAAGLPTLRVYTPNGLHPSLAATVAERGLRRATDRFVAVSAGEAVVAMARGITDPDHTCVIPNGIDLTSGADETGAPDLRRVAGVPERAPLLGFVGRLAAQKCPEAVVAVVAQLGDRVPDLHAVMIGGGRMEDAVRRSVAQHGVQGRVHLVGHLPGARRIMGQLDALILPSRYEGCPYAVIEAMHAGTPVVVSDAVGNRDVVSDGVTGRVVRTGDVAAMADAVAEAMARGPGVQSAIEAARGRVRALHDVRSTSAALARLYSGEPVRTISDNSSA